MVRTIVFIAVVVVLLGIWIGNTVRWTRRNGTLARRSPRMRGDGHLVDDENHAVRRRDQP